MARMKNNADAWKLIFKELNILEEINANGCFVITSNQINDYREARLMTKFDNSDALPEIFKKNKLSILPISNGVYMIAKFCAYKDFEKDEVEIENFQFDSNIQSIDSNNISSEAIAINCLYITDILKDFLEEERVLPTICGKMGSGDFDFYITDRNKNKVCVNIKNARIEIDGGYEGINCLALIEAKNYVSNDFMVRQLYYPFRTWVNKISKKVRPVYVVYSNGVFDLYEYAFEDINDYSSIKLIKHKKYSIEENNIELIDIENILSNIKTIEETSIPFPQANSLERVINLCELLSINAQSKTDITENYAFDKRQTNYYTDAGIYLGLIKKEIINKEIFFSLTPKGVKMMKQKFKTRQLLFVESILEHKIFKLVLENYLENGVIPSYSYIVEKMKECNLYNIGKNSTYKRRASTIKRWIEWIIKLIN